MKKNPGRRERRDQYFKNRRADGKRRMKLNNYYMSHSWLPKFQKFRAEVDAREAAKREAAKV